MLGRPETPGAVQAQGASEPYLGYGTYLGRYVHVGTYLGIIGEFTNV